MLKDQFETIMEQAPLREPERQLYFIRECKKLVQRASEKKGRPLYCCINTFGCQMNARDSEKLLGILLDIGYEQKDSEDADFILFNTCTVRENANIRVYGRIGTLKSHKKNNPDMIIAICGCMMQEKHVVETITSRYPHVNIIFGTHNIYKLAELLFLYFCENTNQIDIIDGTNDIVEDLPDARKYSFKTGVNIMYGCNNFCSYCIVPYVRGRERSRSSSEITEEIKRLADDGVVEIMLLGQNVNSYKGEKTFPQLLKEVSDATYTS